MGRHWAPVKVSVTRNDFVFCSLLCRFNATAFCASMMKTLDVCSARTWVVCMSKTHCIIITHPFISLSLLIGVIDNDTIVRSEACTAHHGTRVDSLEINFVLYDKLLGTWCRDFDAPFDIASILCLLCVFLTTYYPYAGSDLYAELNGRLLHRITVGPLIVSALMKHRLPERALQLHGWFRFGRVNVDGKTNGFVVTFPLNFSMSNASASFDDRLNGKNK